MDQRPLKWHGKGLSTAIRMIGRSASCLLGGVDPRECHTLSLGFHDMRILHTSDWHLGRSFHGVRLLDAQAEMLDHLVEIVRAESVDVVVVAGDLYDRAVPGADAVHVLSEGLTRLTGAGARVVGISGNHDSAIRLGWLEPIVASAGVSLRGDVATVGRPVLVPRPGRHGGGDVAFYPVPYLEPESARHVLSTPEARTHDRLLQVALDRARHDLASRPGVRSVAVIHAFVTGGQSSDSELALTVGGSAEVPLRQLTGFDYIALGHLHGRQSLGDGRARYAGSPIAYSFSERGHTKGAWLVDLPATGAVQVAAIDLPVHRRLYELRGDLETLLRNAEATEAERGYVQAVLTDSLLPRDAMVRLRQRFPHVLTLQHSPALAAGVDALHPSYATRVRGRDDLTLATDFVEHVAGRPPTDAEHDDLCGAIAPSAAVAERAA